MTTLTAAPHVEPPRRTAMNGNAADFMCDEVRRRISFLEHPQHRPGAARGGFAHGVRMASPPTHAGGALDLPARIELLIQAEGSASALARRCGFSEGAVRNWRDGRSDMSRERCITLAQALGISLLWLVSGEGAMRTESRPGDSAGASAAAMARSSGGGAAAQPRASTVDPRLLASALRLLQSYIGLAGGSLDSPQRADALVELYELLERAGEPGHAERLIAFHAGLRNLLRGNRRVLIA
jgi:hypothetical protein